MNKHVKLVAFIFLVWGAMGLLATLTILIIGAAGSTAAAFDDPKAGLVIGTLMLVALLISAIVSIPNILAGWGLLKHRQWARVLTIILAILNIFAFPIGTAIGVYALWVLFHGETQRLFRQEPVSATPG
jgi:hypothetical protein